MSSAARFSGIEARRSTRIDRTVPVIIMGQTKLGLSFQERTSAVSMNVHGCRYPSRHDYSVGSWVALQVLEANGESNAPLMRAQVRSIHPPMSPRELYQIGVELEAPTNAWGVATPPDDWQRALGASAPKMQMATGTAPAREPVQNPAVRQAPAVPEFRSTGVAAFPVAPAASPAKQAPTPGAVRPERVVITSDQLIAAVQGKLQAAADKAVQNAVSTHLTESVRQALTKIDDVCRASVHQMEEYSAQRLEVMMRAMRDDVLGQMEQTFAEDRGHVAEQQDAHRGRIEEIAQRVENLAADAQRNLAEVQNSLAEMQKLTARTGEIEPQIRNRIDQSIMRATEDFDAAATRVADRQLVRLMEDKQMVTREASSQLAACAAEMRALLQSSASGTLEEFRRQMDVQVDLSISEATQRVMSSLASLDAENRAACEARRRSIEADVARATEQSTEQFRTGMKAFLYSCLVAAVGAVDEHAKTTFDGLVKDQSKAVLEMGAQLSSPVNGETAAASEHDTPHRE